MKVTQAPPQRTIQGLFHGLARDRGAASVSMLALTCASGETETTAGSLAPRDFKQGSTDSPRPVGSRQAVFDGCYKVAAWRIP